MRLVVLLTQILLLAACGKMPTSTSSGLESTDSGGGSTNGGQGQLTEGTYMLSAATYSDGSATNSYTLSNNNFTGVLTWDDTATDYKVIFTGSVTYTYSGGSTGSGCSSGSRIETFQLDSSGNIQNDKILQDCTSASNTTGIGITITSDNVVLGVRRSIKYRKRQWDTAE